jgi:pyruvate dehydrogenase E1 component alpha subunit
MGDAEAYRPKGELDKLRALDPIPALKARMMKEDGFSAEEDNLIVQRARARVDDAIAFARASPYPEPFEAMDKVFA